MTPDPRPDQADEAVPSPHSELSSEQDVSLDGPGLVEETGQTWQPGMPPEKIDRVIDVPLAVTLRFGQRHLTLREVLALTTGSLVELDRQVEEPVELVLGDRLIARGEVVVVDGNYGLRVVEVIEGATHRMGALSQAALQAPTDRGTPA